MFKYSMVFNQDGYSFFSVPVKVIADDFEEAIEKANDALPKDDKHKWELQKDKISIAEVINNGINQSA